MQEGDSTDGKAPATFSFSFGKPVAPGEPGLGELGDTGSSGSRIAKFEIADGKLRLDVGEGRQVEYDLALEEGTGEYHDPFPTLTMFRRWLNAAVTILAIAVPIALAILGVATGQTLETTFYMTLFGLIISTMLLSSRPKRTWFSDLLTNQLTAMIRRSQQSSATNRDAGPAKDPPV